MVSVAGKEVVLPYLQNGVSISRHAGYTFLEAWKGDVIVKYDGESSIYVQLASQYKNGTCGLCGNYNANPKDDFQLPHDLGIAEHAYKFGNAWEKPKPGQVCVPVTETHDHGSECNKVSSMIAMVSSMKCKLLQQYPGFQKCSGVIDPEPFIKECKEDVCACKGDSSCVCKTFSEYSRRCAHHSIVLNWRNANLCRKYYFYHVFTQFLFLLSETSVRTAKIIK